MKLTVILCLVFQISVLAKAQNVSLHFKDRPLFEVLNEIARQADITFTYGESVVRISKPVTVSVSKVPFIQALRLCLEGQPLTFRLVEDKVVVIMPISKVLPEDRHSSVDTLGDIEFSGQVMDEKGNALPGATVRILSLARGTQTDVLGKFKIKGNMANRKLLITYTGFKNQYIEAGQKPVVVYLQLAAEQLDKVVVQGYGTTTQRLATGNIATISAKDIETQPVQNVLQAIQGRVAGLVVTQTSGYASAPFKMELRGRSSISKQFPSDPLVIVDGVPLTVISGAPGSGGYETGSTGFVQNGFTPPAGGQSPLYSIDPDDIETISVLKDADATAIYGSRGGRGVILISTKKGKNGKMSVDFNVSLGQSFVKNHYDMLTTPEYVAMRFEAFKNSNITPNRGNAYDILVWDTTRQTDWQKEFWGKPAKNSDYKIAFSGGDKNNNYRVSLGYNKLTNLNSFSGFDERASVLFNTGHRTPNNRIGIELSLIYSFTKNNNLSLSGSATTSPNAPPIFDDNGKLNYAGWAPISNRFSFGSVLQPYVGKTRFLNSNLKTDIIISKNFKFTTSLGYSTQNMFQNTKVPIASQNPVDMPLGAAVFGTNNGSRIIIEPMLEYKARVWKGDLTAILGGTYQSVDQDGVLTNGFGYTNDKLLGSISNAAGSASSDVTGKYKYAAIFGRANYNLFDKYLVTLSGRRDGSSRFGPGKQYGTFGAIATAWIFSNEEFIKDNVSFLSFGKLRASYGITGSDNIVDYAYLTRWSSNNLRYMGMTGSVPIEHANPDLQWQTDRKFEVGLNLGFIKDRILLNIAWYQHRSGNQLLSFSLPYATGFSSVTANFPATVQNVGWEPQLTASLIKNEKLELTLSALVGINRNRLISFPGIEKTAYASVMEVGKSLNRQKMLIYLGVDPATGKYLFQDINKDGEISSSIDGPDVVYKDLSMQFDGGFGFDLRFKNLQLNVYFTARKWPGKNALNPAGWYGGASNIPREALNRWQKPSDVSAFPRYSVFPGSSDLNFNMSDGRYTDASFIRLSNASVSYNLPQLIQRKIGSKICKLFLRGQNLFLISKYKGSDPEVQVFGNLPPLTTVDGGIQLSF